MSPPAGGSPGRGSGPVVHRPAAPRLSAAEFSAPRRQVRDTFAPRAEELRAGRPGGLRSAIALATRTAQAIWKRDRLTADQYASFTGTFAARGVPLPPGALGSGVSSD